MKYTTTRFDNKADGLRRWQLVALFRVILVAVLTCGAGVAPLRGAVLMGSDITADDYFGSSVSVFGNTGFVGASGNRIGSNTDQGSAYLFRNLETATGTITENVRLLASDGQSWDSLGSNVSLSGNIGLVTAPFHSLVHTNQGSAYIFRNLDTATGTITQNAKLIASDGGSRDKFGLSASLEGSTSLIGAWEADVGANFTQGAAYIHRNLNTATGILSENAKLIASDGRANDYFGVSVSLSNNTGLVGAYVADVGVNMNQGSAYLFRNLDTATGTITENVKLVASNGIADENFGRSVSLQGNTGLVGAPASDIQGSNGKGSAYLFRNLDTATGTITQSAKLIASDGASRDNFGVSVSLSGSNAILGAYFDDGDRGSAYLFRQLDTASGTITESVKLLASDGATQGEFGRSVSVDGDLFLIGAHYAGPAPLFSRRGKAYSGSVSSVTTLDAGNTIKTISGLSFISQDDWIIGQTSDANQVTLSAGDAATVSVSGKKVIIGQNAGSDNNRLIIAGTLTASQIQVGAIGNTGNVLQLGNGGTTGTLSTGSVITNHGSVVFNRSVATTQGTHFGTVAIIGTGSVTQAGLGTTTFNTAHTYSGDTLIKAGTLKLDLAGGIPNSTRIIVGDAGSSNAKLDVTTKTGGFTVGAAQTLFGIGQIDGNTLILGKHSPGNSPGLQSMNGNLGYGGGSQLDWELAANVSSDSLGLRGMNFDGVDVIGAGVLTIQAGVTSNLIFNAAGSTVDWNNAFWDSDHTWLVYDNTNAPTLPLGSIFETINVSADSLGATLTDGAFSWSTVGNDLHLNYTVIPEPSTWVLGALSFLGLSIAGWGKKTKRGVAL